MNDVILKLVTISAMNPVSEVLAKDGQFGILEGKTVALIHPTIMLGLFFYTLYKYVYFSIICLRIVLFS
jgi:hypothetical protein